MTINDISKIDIPGYQVLSKLGQGAMAQVYLAMQQGLERKVALKIMAETLLVDPEFSERFLREAKIIAQLSHPHIVSVYDVGVHQGCHYLAMEYHAGGDLKKRIAAGLSIDETLRITRQIAKALQFAHSEGYIHRDVKPENILFDRHEDAILTDFGIARSGDATAQMTAVGTIIGTPKYMSPEQAKGEEVDGRSDIYSLGVILFEMLTGKAPYTADNPIAICQMHVMNPVPELPAALAKYQDIVNDLMAKDRQDRVASGNDIIAMLDALEKTPSAAKPMESDAETLVSFRKNMVQNVDFATADDDKTVSMTDRPLDTTVDRTQGTTDNVYVHSKRHWQSTQKKNSIVPRLAIALASFAVVAILGFKFVLSDQNSEAVDVAFLTETETETVSGQKTPINIDAPEVVIPKTVDTTGLVKSLNIISPQTKSLCTTKEPYLLGERVIGENDSLNQGECFSIKVEGAKNIELLVFSHSQNGTIYRLFPNNCNAMGFRGKLHGGQLVTFPVASDKRLTVIGLDENPGREWIYAIGVSDASAKDSVLRSLGKVPDVCGKSGGGNLAVKSVQQQLDKLSVEHEGRMHWLSRSFNHQVL